VYRYVYDCGSTGQGVLANQRANEFLNVEKLYGADRPDIHMLVISHFHSDHVNGVPNLFLLFNVRRLVIPYLATDAQIIALAHFASLGPDAWSRFHLLVTDPRAWVDAQNGEGNTEIVQVHGDEGDDAPQEESAPPPFEDGNGFSLGSPHLSKQPWIDCPGAPVQISDTAPVAIFNAKRSVWTFRFYVQDRPTLENLIIADLLNKLRCTSRGDLLKNLNEQAWIQSNWETIRGCVKAQAPKEQNKTTLCMFSGPKPNHTLRETRLSFLPHALRYPWMSARNIGWLGTGDAELADAGRYQSFENHYAGFIEKTLTLSIPHHGSVENYHPKLARIGRAHVITASAGDAKHPAPAVCLHIQSECGNPLVVTREGWTQLFECFDMEFSN
ncbi:MAG: MBL fold metallo-hydrolase, partial [Gammaproteobacteria bacterium]|nr:MBL fold metallo-hydrolase [Gammaproteobacteria bacterium]